MDSFTTPSMGEIPLPNPSSQLGRSPPIPGPHHPAQRTAEPDDRQMNSAGMSSLLTAAPSQSSLSAMKSPRSPFKKSGIAGRPESRYNEAAYGLLAKVIARASVRRLRHSSPSIEQARGPTRPSIQHRRSLAHIGSTLTFPMPLRYDRRLWEQAPPLIASHNWNQPACIDYFFAPAMASRGACNVAQARITDMPRLGDEIARASSAPAMSSSPHRRWHSLDVAGPADTNITPVSAKGPPRFAIDPIDFSSYLDPQLSAALQHRLEQATGAKIATPGEETTPETEWSFLIPLAEAISDALVPHIEATGHCTVVEYGCYRDAPNPAVKTVLKAVAQHSSDAIVTVSHDCPSTFDNRPLRNALHSSPFSYRNSRSLSCFSFADFCDAVAAPATVDLGIGGRDLFHLHGLPASKLGIFSTSQAVEREKLAEESLSSWLAVRAREFKTGGLLVIHLPLQTSPRLVRSPRNSFLEGSRLVTGSTTDLWSAMLSNLEPAVQRLVSLGEIRNSVAPMLLDVSYWPRSLKSLQRSLSMMNDWVILPGNDKDGDWQEWERCGVRVHRIEYPPWTAFLRGEIDRATYAHRIATYCRSIYELHFKQVLRQRGKVDIGTTERIVQELFKILQDRCETGKFDGPLLDVGVIVLKRR